jgi:DNA invertase Pin-like site-specific DNA recombinase
MTTQRVIGYVRVSTQEQVEGFGLAVQRDGIRAYCKERGLRLVDIASDEGISGSNGLDTRPGLTEALLRVEDHEVSGLVVYRLDRLARDLLLQETILAQMRKRGGEVLSVSEPDIDSDDPTRILVRQVLGAIAQYERAMIRRRTAAGRAKKVAAGGYGGGRPKYGYKAEHGELVADENEQAVIVRVVALRDQGKSLREIASVLNSEGVQPRTTGARWHSATVGALTDMRATSSK